jgi:hypothetical protein
MMPTLPILAKLVLGYDDEGAPIGVGANAPASDNNTTSNDRLGRVTREWSLTPRQTEVLEVLVQDKSNKDLASAMLLYRSTTSSRSRRGVPTSAHTVRAERGQRDVTEVLVTLGATERSENILAVHAADRELGGIVIPASRNLAGRPRANVVRRYGDQLASVARDDAECVVYGVLGMFTCARAVIEYISAMRFQIARPAR